MPAPETAADASRPGEILPDELAEVGRYGTTQEGFEHSLVVLALGRACWLMAAETGYRLLVEAPAAELARRELAIYDRESAGWPPPMPSSLAAARRLDLVTPLFWAAAVLAVFRWQLLHLDWADAGALDTAAVFGQGEWWRAVTALFLHSDGQHLASNLVAGVFVFAAVLSGFGRARGWLLVGASAVLGNVIVAAAHYPGPYRSLGASTAVFAALGLLTGRAVRLAAGALHPHRWRSFFVPAMAGVSVLALYGAGGPQVDVFAHGAGFSVGAVLGFIASGSMRRSSS